MAVFGLVLAVGLILLSGCPPKPPNLPPVVPGDIGYPLCTGGASVTSEDICGSLFTPDGYACAACRGLPNAGAGSARGCINDEALVYCAAGSCFDDPRCELVDRTRDGGKALNRAAHAPRFK